jgi:NTP pyrophosphatase (non-canonical NTP hydrolase)
MYTEIESITRWLDASNPPSKYESAMRILKISEELGEVTQAFVGLTGQNPRKGVTHTLAQVLDELADVVITAACAIQYFTQDIDRTADIIEEKLIVIQRRGNRHRVNRLKEGS